MNRGFDFIEYLINTKKLLKQQHFLGLSEAIANL